MISSVGMSKLRRLTLCITLIAGTQLGHAASYFLRYGATAASQESSGLHAYYPALSGTLSAIVGGILMACMAILAASRLVRGAAPGGRMRRSVRVGDVLPALFTAQLLLFLAQESIECLVGGRAVPSPMEEVLWGVFGQLPAALVASIVVSWLSARMEAAWAVLLAGVTQLLPDDRQAVPVERAPRRAPQASPALASTFPRAFRKRGPPPLPYPAGL